MTYEYRLLDHNIWRESGADMCTNCGAWIANRTIHNKACPARKHRRKKTKKPPKTR